MVAIALIIALCLGGGVSFAAENAVPGDALYVVKTEVNENVRAALAVSAEAEARWQAHAAERRLKEAEELSARGELSADVAADLGAQFSEHAEAAFEGAQSLEAEGNSAVSAEITAQLETAVSLYASLFTREYATGKANGARTFVLPHVLEKSGIRVSGGDVDGDGKAEIRIDGGTIKSETSVEASGGSSAEANSRTKIEGSTNVELGL